MGYLNRKQKIVRNLLFCALLPLSIWAALGFPPQTVAGMCRQIRRQYLLPEVEPVLVRRTSYPYYGERHVTKFTYMLARSEDEYMAFQYRRQFLQNKPERHSVVGQGRLCTAWNHVLYVAGPLQEAASAAAVVTVEQNHVTLSEGEQGELLEFRLEGERLGEEVFGFPYITHEHDDGVGTRPWQEDEPEEMDLLDAIGLWYWRRVPTENGESASLTNEELPCVMTLYDEDGAVLDTWDLTIGTYYLNQTRW